LLNKLAYIFRSIQSIRKYTLAFLQNFLHFKQFYYSRKRVNESDNLKREYVQYMKRGNDPSPSSRIQLHQLFEKTDGLGLVARMGEESGVNRLLVGKAEGKSPLGRLRRKWVDKIRMDLQEVGCGYMDWIGLAQDRDRWWALVSAVMNLRIP
jgi:hypothetical protein